MTELKWLAPVDDYAADMQRQIADRMDSIGEWISVKTHEGAMLLARYHWWGARLSANPGEHIRCAKGHYAMARDMKARPDEYQFPRRDAGQTCWLRFKELQRSATGDTNA